MSSAAHSKAFIAQRDAIERSLRESPGRPPDDQPLFVALMAPDGKGVVTITPPGAADGRCLPVFSSPFRAADYVQRALGHAVRYLSSSPLQFVAMIRDLRRFGIERFTLDRCPRCDVFTAIGSDSMTSADLAIDCWSIWKATEFARLELYLAHARRSAVAGNLDAAREVALETAAHVSFEDPRVHLCWARSPSRYGTAACCGTRRRSFTFCGSTPGPKSSMRRSAPGRRTSNPRSEMR